MQPPAAMARATNSAHWQSEEDPQFSTPQLAFAYYTGVRIERATQDASRWCGQFRSSKEHRIFFLGVTRLGS